MDVQPDLRHQARNVFAARGYVEALHDQAEAGLRGGNPRPALETLRQRLVALVEGGDEIIRGLRALAAQEIVSDQLYGILGATLDCVDGCRDLAATREPLVEACPLAEEYWPEEIQARLASQADQFDECYSALADKRGALEQTERELAVYIATTAGTRDDLAPDLEAAGIENLLATTEDANG